MATRKRKAKKKTTGGATHRLVLVKRDGTRKTLTKGTRAEVNKATKACAKLGVCIVERIPS